MPKKVDHDVRRQEIAAAVARIAIDRGLQQVSFREVAAEAGMSVSLVQHYFGTKENLLIGTLEIRSAIFGQRISRRLGALGADARPLDRLRTVADGFLPSDRESRDAMLVYHAFAAAALTDASLRKAAAFRNADDLMGVLAGLVAEAQDRGEVAASVDPQVSSRSLLSLVLGLSLGVLLEQMTVQEVRSALDAHIAQLSATIPG